MPADFLPPDLPTGSASAEAGSNAPPFLSITELSQLLKRTTVYTPWIYAPPPKLALLP